MVKKFFMFKRPFFGIFVALLFSLSIFSCENVTWNQPVHAWFEEYTSTAAVGNYSMTPGAYSCGNLVNVVGSYEDLNIALYMRNPKKYQIDSSIVFDDGFEFNSAECLKQVAYDELSLVIPKDFLRDHDAGGNLSFTVNLKEHVTQRSFNDYHLDLTCNSVPEKALNPTVLSMSGSPDVFVVAFDMPSADELKKIHKDLVSVDIDGSSYPLSVLEDGSVDFGSASFSRTSPGTLSSINKQFVHTDRAVYYVTGETFFRGDKSYSITFTDSAGLKSTAVASTTVSKLSYPGVTDNDGNLLSINTEAVLHIDSEDGATGSKVTVQVPDSDDMGNSVSGIKIGYRLMSGNDIQASSDSLNPDPVNVTVPSEGEYTLVVWAEKPGYEKSIEAEYKLKLVYASLKAPVVKDGETELDSGASVTNYIPLPGNGSDASVTICLPTQDESGNNVSGVTMSYLLKFSTAASGSPIDDIKADKPVGGLSLGIWNLSVTATKPGYKASSSEYKIRVFGPDIWVNSGGTASASGTQEDPYSSLQYAVNDIKTFKRSDVDYTIHIEGKVEGATTIPDSLKAKSITIQGETKSGISGKLSGDGNNSTIQIKAGVDVTIKNLVLTGGYRGIYIDNDVDTSKTVVLESGTEVTGNSAWNTDASGGGVYLKTGKLEIKSGCSIYKNSSALYGGGVYVESGAEATLSGGTIGSSTAGEGNSCSGGGGGVYSKGKFTMTSGKIIGNTVSGKNVRGGGVYSHTGSTFEMTGGTIKGNTATATNNFSAFGGGISTLDCTTFSISGGTIEENKATGGNNNYGGGIYFAGKGAGSGYAGCTGIITGTAKIKKNSAKYGGGITIATWPGMLISGGTIGGANDSDANTASLDGGGVYLEGQLTLTGGAIKNNTAPGKGSGIALTDKAGKDTQFYMKENAKVDSSNGVYLPKLNTGALRSIIVPDSLTSSYPVATISPGEYNESSPGTVLTGSAVSTQHMKFAVTDNDVNDNYTWGVDNQGRLVKGYNTSQAASVISGASGAETIKLIGPVILSTINNAMASNSNSEARIGLDLSCASSISGWGQSCFIHNSKLERIILPEFISSIPAEAFFGCSNLQYVYIPASVTSIDGTAFYRVPATVDFAGNSTLLKEGNVIYTADKKKLVLYCNRNKEDKFDFTVPSSVEEICSAAFGCSGLKSISFNSTLKTIGEYAFDLCESLTSINIPDTVTTIGKWAFYGCKMLSTVKLSKNITVIPEFLFSDCISMTSIKIPEGVTKIGECAFSASGYSNISSLASIYIPKSLTQIDAQAFGFCKVLANVYFRGSSAEKTSLINNTSDVYYLDPDQSNKWIKSAKWHTDYTY